MREEVLEETDEDNAVNATDRKSLHYISCLSYYHGPSLSVNRTNMFTVMVTVSGRGDSDGVLGMKIMVNSPSYSSEFQIIEYFWPPSV